MDEATTEPPRNDPAFRLNPPTLISLFYLATWFTGFTALVGVVLAYAWRREETAKGWEQTHYVFHIRTFWLGVGGLLIGATGFFALVFGTGGPGEAESPVFVALVIVALGLALLLAVLLVVRCAFALINAQRELPMPKPKSLWV